MRQPETGWVSRWVVSLCEPLLDVRSRQETENAMERLTAENPVWVAAWASGWLSDIMRSLDPADPWRNLTVEDHQARHPNGSPFGSWVDATDIVHAGTEDIRSDLGLAALAEQLDPEAAELLAAAAESREAAFAWLKGHQATGPQLFPGEAEKHFRIIASALRWAIYRRRLFAGAEDPFVPISGTEWIRRAPLVAEGKAWDEARAAKFVDESAVGEGTYEQFL